MRKAEVELGAVYAAKVSGKLTTVRIVNESTYGGWNAVNLTTKHQVRIRGAARLKRKVELLSFYLDEGRDTREISRPEAIGLVHDTYGIGTWIEHLAAARTSAGLELTGGRALRVRANDRRQL
jgi:hypothetical protein